jgi:dihydropyrimidinase
MKILIKHARIVTSEKNFVSNIIIEKGIIVGIKDSVIEKDFDEIIDATNNYVFPGGIDPHVHMHLPTSAGFSTDDFYSGSKAALIGGTTTLIDFVTPRKEQNLVEALKQRKKEAESSVIDYSFHVSPVDWHNNIENEINEVIKNGVNSFKVYMAYKNSIGLSDEVLVKVMKSVAKVGGLLTVHAEDGDTIEKLRVEFAAKGKTSPMYHALSRPNYTEADAVKKIIEFSEKTSCKVYIVHVSTHESVKYIKEAQTRGIHIYAETCPQYLLFDDSKLNGAFSETAKFVFSPPLRKKHDNTALWNALSESVIQTVGTDHCPFNYEQKKTGENDFRIIPGGAGGTEHRLSLLFTYGVLKNKISLNQFVALTSTNAAKIFGLYPQKGEIAVGSDADIVIWNPETENRISVLNHHQNCNLNIYENFKTIGEPEVIILKGRIVYKQKQLFLSNRNGQFLKR